MPSYLVYQPIQQPSVRVGTRVRFVKGGTEYQGTVSAIALRPSALGGIYVTVATEGAAEERTVPLSIIRLA